MVIVNIRWDGYCAPIILQLFKMHVYAAKVDSLWYAGNYAAAQDASKKAGTWAIVSAASAVGIWIIYLIVAVCIAGAAFSLVPFANL